MSMETPKTPSSEMWWRLMGDEHASPRPIKTPITPRSFASLWSSPNQIPGNDDNDDDTVSKGRRSTSKTLVRSAAKQAEKQRRKSADDARLFALSRQRNERNAKPVKVARDEDSLLGASVHETLTNSSSSATRINMIHRDNPMSPLSGPSKKNKTSRVTILDDEFDDNMTYEGPAEKFLDVLEESLCTAGAPLISTPSICELEKRIEESWKEIEYKTAQFFKCRRVDQEANTNGNRQTQQTVQDKDNDKVTRTRSLPYDDHFKRINKRDEDDEEKKPQAVNSPQTEESRDEEYESLDEDEESIKAQDRYVPRPPRTKEKETQKKDGISQERNTDDDGDANSEMRDDAVALNSYTGTYIQKFKERHGVVDPPIPVPDSESTLSLCPTDYDASTLSTIQTQSLSTEPSTSVEAPFLAPSSLVPPKKGHQRHKNVKEQAETSLTVYEPTCSSSLLLKNSTSSKGSQLNNPVRLSTDGTGFGNHYSQVMPDLDPNFQKRCFSPPTLGKKSSMHSLGILNSVSTSSTEPSALSQSQKSTDSKSEPTGPSAGNHAYVAYFERGTDAKGVIRLYEHPTPAAFPTLQQEVVVRISYSTISHTDCAIRRGRYWGDDSQQPLSLPIIPGVAFSGHVTQLNRNAMRSGLRYGDRVLSLVRVGANARHVCIARDRIVIVPDELKDEKKTACLPEVYLGAFQVLHMGQKNSARYKKSSLAGKSVLILGGATILGKALIELCHDAGADAVYATGKERHYAAIEAANATPVNRDPRHWYALLRGRIDLVIGLDNDSFRHSEASAQHLEVLSEKGRAILFGGPECTCDATIDKRKKIFIYNVFDSWEKDLKQAKRDLSHLCKLLLEGAIDPCILETIPLRHIAQAQDTVEHRDFSAFLLCDPWTPTKREAEKVLPRTVLSSGETTGLASETKSNEKKRGTMKRSSAESLSRDELLSI